MGSSLGTAARAGDGPTRRGRNRVAERPLRPSSELRRRNGPAVLRPFISETRSDTLWRRAVGRPVTPPAVRREQCFGGCDEPTWPGSALEVDRPVRIAYRRAHAERRRPAEAWAEDRNRRPPRATCPTHHRRHRNAGPGRDRHAGRDRGRRATAGHDRDGRPAARTATGRRPRRRDRRDRRHPRDRRRGLRRLHAQPGPLDDADHAGDDRERARLDPDGARRDELDARHDRGQLAERTTERETLDARKSRTSRHRSPPRPSASASRRRRSSS